MQVDDLIIVSDLDGTLLPHSGEISAVNLAAIEKFRSLGGTFTVATGRSPIQAKKYLDILGVNSPIIANNGANIYDPAKHENLWAKSFEPDYKRVIYDIINNFKNVGIVTISSDDRYEVIAENNLVSEFRGNKGITFYDATNISNDCCKVLFLVNSEDLAEVSAFAINQKYESESFVISAMTCLEMMPKGISKGYPFEKLLDFYGKKQENSVAIGDYHNDIEMIQKAKLGVCVFNALDNVKEIADLCVKSCDEDGIADLIEYILKAESL